MLVIMIASKVVRGPGDGKDSVFGLDICSEGAWAAYAFLVVAALLLTYFAAKVAKNDYQNKLANGYKFCKGDQELNTKNQMKLVGIAFGGAFAATTCGLAPGLVFYPTLINMDMHPVVASATGMYLALWTTLAGTILVLLNDALNIPFSLLINILTIIGTIPGLKGQIWVVQKAGGRNQFTVMILLAFLIFQLVTILPLSLVEAMNAKDTGEDITAFKEFCE